jgi:hypothetical protein
MNEKELREKLESIDQAEKDIRATDAVHNQWAKVTKIVVAIKVKRIFSEAWQREVTLDAEEAEMWLEFLQARITRKKKHIAALRRDTESGLK